MASGTFNGPFQTPTFATNNISANNPNMVNAWSANNGFNSLSHLNQLSKANTAQAAEGKIPSLARKAGNIVGKGINAAKGAIGKAVMTPSLAALGGVAAEAAPVAGIIGPLAMEYTYARGAQMDKDPNVQAEKAIRANAIKDGWIPDNEDNWTNTQGQAATFNDIYGMYGPEGSSYNKGEPTPEGVEAAEAMNKVAANDFQNYINNPFVYKATPPSLIFGDTPAQQATVNAGTNPQTSTSTPSTTKAPTLDQVVNGVIAGTYGNGADRKAAIEALGMNYGDVQKAVNAKMRGTSSGTNKVKTKDAGNPDGKKTGNWMETLNNLLPFLALAGGAYYAGRKL